MRIYVSGSIARDLIMDFPGRFADRIDPKKIHVLNISFGVQNLKESVGGTAANICYNLALLGESPTILGAVGYDGKAFKSHFRKLGTEIGYLKISKDKRTAGAFIITDRDDNQITGFYKGAMMEEVRLPTVKRDDWAIIASDNPENMIKLASWYSRNQIRYIYDPGQAITSLDKRQLEVGIKNAQVLIGNDYEIGIIARNIDKPKYRGLTVVKTLGPKGSEILAGGRKIKIGIAKPKKVLDPTGAGDAYRAGFLKGLVLGYNLETCGRLGATVASFAVEEYGTQRHKFTQRDIATRYFKNFREQISLPR